MTKIPILNQPNNYPTQNRRFTVSIRFVLRYTPARIKESTLYVRTTVNGTRAPEKSLNMKVIKSEWNSAAQLLDGNTDQAQIYNARLKQIRALFDKTFFLMQQSGEVITARRLQEKVFGEKVEYASYKEAFTRFIQEKQITSKVSSRTIESYEKYFRNISSFLSLKGNKNILLHDITEQSMLDMLNYFREKYAQDYAVKHVQFFRSIYTYAVSKGMVDKNPLTSVRLEKLSDYDTSHLTQEEVQKISNFDFTKLNLPLDSIRVLDEERDALIFTCYTGLHHSDYKKGEFELAIYNGRTWLSGYRIKSKGGRRDKPYSIPLHPLALAVIEKYGGVGNLPKRNNAKRNQVLKNIAAYTDVKVNLTTKIARKTLADYCLNTLQMRQEVLASILGHVSTKFIKHYAKINNKSIDEAMQFEQLKHVSDDLKTDNR